MFGRALVLAVALTVGDVPVPTLAETEECLPVGGKWEGTWQDGRGLVINVALQGVGTPGTAVATVWVPIAGFPGPRRVITNYRIADEGRGNVRIVWNTHPPRGAGQNCLGIYSWDGDLLFICFGDGDRPTSFHGGRGQHLLTLRRVRPEE
jgi:hypothetical protein